MTSWTIARRALPLLLLAIEVAWLLPWAHLVGILLVPASARPAPGARADVLPLVPDWLLVVVVVMAWAVRCLAPGRRSIHDVLPAWRRFLGTGAAVAAVGGGASAALHLRPSTSEAPAGWVAAVAAGHEPGALLVTIAFLGIAWWRGAATGATSPGDRHAGRLATGAGGAIAVASAVATAVLPSMLASIVPVAATVAIPSMIGALALAALEDSQLPRPGAPVGAPPDRTWLAMVVAVAVGIAVVGGVLALVLGGQADAVIAILRSIGAVVGTAFVLVASVAVIPILWFAAWLARIMQGRAEPPPDLGLSGMGRESFLDRFEQVEPEPLLDPAIIEVALALAVLSIVAFAAWRLLMPSAPGDLDGAESEVRSSVFSWRSLFPRRGPGSAADMAVTDVVHPVRRAYRDFLAAMALHGVRRATDETPAALSARLRHGSTEASVPAAGDPTAIEPLRPPPAASDPSFDDDLDTLTVAYERARYGPRSDHVGDDRAVEAGARLAADAARTSARVHPS